MRRGFWFSAGVAAGVYGMVKARQVAEAFTPDGIRDRLGAVGVGARMLRDEVAQGTADAEADIRQHYGIPAPGTPDHPVLPGADHAPPRELTNEQKDQR